MRVNKKELARRLMQTRKQRQRAKMWPLTLEVRSKIDEYEKAAASEAKGGRLEKQRYPRVW